MSSVRLTPRMRFFLSLPLSPLPGPRGLIDLPGG